LAMGLPHLPLDPSLRVQNHHLHCRNVSFVSFDVGHQ